MKEALVHMLPHSGSVDTRINRVLQYNKHEISNTIPEYKEPKGKLLYGIGDASMGMTATTETNEGIYWNGELNLQHLYFTIDEEIKEGDQITDDIDIGKYEGPNYDLSWEHLVKNGRKIVAATNPELWHKLPVSDWYHNKFLTGRIPQSFIQQYVDSQGSIKKVILEEIEQGIGAGYKDYKMILRLNSSGEVIIHLLEQKMYTRDYVFQCVQMLGLEVNKSSERKKQGLSYKDILDWFDKRFPQ